MPTVLSRTIVASGAATPFSIQAGETFTIHVQVVNPQSVNTTGKFNPIDLTGGALTLAVKALDSSGLPTGTTPLISREATITDGPNGLADLPLVIADTNSLQGGYCWDLWFEDATGNRTPVIPLSTFTVLPTVGHHADPVTVPPSQSPLAQGPVGPQGPPGSSNAAPYSQATRPSASANPYLVIINTDTHGIQISDGTNWRDAMGNLA